MTVYDRQDAERQLADPLTPPHALRDIALKYPELRDQVRQHPSVYPGLVEWIAGAEAEALPGAVAHANAYTEQPVSVQPPQVGYTGPQGFPAAQAGLSANGAATPSPPKLRTGLIVTVAAISALILAAIGIAIPLAMNGGPSSVLAHVKKPSGTYSLTMVDTARLQEALGEPFAAETLDEIIEWRQLGFAGDEELVSTMALSWPTVEAQTAQALALVIESGGMVRLVEHESDQPQLFALLGGTSASALTDSFGPARGEIWRDGAGLYFTQTPGATYFALDSAALPTVEVDERESVAHDSAFAAVLRALVDSGGYTVHVSNDDYALNNAETATGTRPDEIYAYGSALGLREGQPFLVVAYDFGTPELATENRELIEEALTRSADRLEQNAPLRVEAEENLVVAELEINSNDLESTAFVLRNLYDW